MSTKGSPNNEKNLKPLGPCIWEVPQEAPTIQNTAKIVHGMPKTTIGQVECANRLGIG